MLRVTGIAPRIEGLGLLPTKRPFVILANHASFIDGLVLTASLPIDFAFVAKRELVEGLVAGTFLRRLGTVFVERFDPAGGVESAHDVMRALEAGESLVVFPEGTFDRRSGLRAFHIGAFVAACQTGIAVVPVGLSGTRGILRGNSAFARHGQIQVAVGSAIQRKAVLALCREPDLIGELTAF